MIFLRISSDNEKQIEAIAAFLLENRLAIDLNIKRHIERLDLEKGKVVSKTITLITCKTKGLLFPVIDEQLRKLFPDSMPELYSLPIVHMDWDQSHQLVKSVQEV